VNSVIVGGKQNIASGNGTFAGGGDGNQASGQYTVVSGGQANTAGSTQAGVSFSTIAGGWSNRALSSYATVSGGAGNNAGTYGSIGGGQWNIARGSQSTVAGGANNTCDGVSSTIGGGYYNVATSVGSTVCGGISNVANGPYSFIAGGIANSATNYAFAAGYGARATNQGAFVWSSQVMTLSTNSYSFTVRAPGGVRFMTSTKNVGAILAPNATAWSVLSDKNIKDNFKPIDEKKILRQLKQMPVTAWNYKFDPKRQYIGPTAQDFKAAFGLGNDDKSINSLDASGVTLAAVKGMGQEVDELRSELKRKDLKIQALEKKLNEVADRLNHLPAPIAAQ
jgi:hypothetical protein